METRKVNDVEKISAKLIKDIREKWPKHFPDEHKPPLNGIVVSISLRDADDHLMIKDITIMEPNGTEWNIVMCGGEVIEYGITIPSSDIMESMFDKGPVGVLPSDQFTYLSPGPELLKHIELKTKKVIHRRIILD